MIENKRQKLLGELPEAPLKVLHQARHADLFRRLRGCIEDGDEFNDGAYSAADRLVAAQGRHLADIDHSVMKSQPFQRSVQYSRRLVGIHACATLANEICPLFQCHTEAEDIPGT